MIDYIDVISKHYPNIQCETKGEPDNYGAIVWVSGGVISKEELDSQALNQAKAEHTQALSDEAERRIRSGFWSNALGSPHFYDSDIEDQINLIGVVTVGTDSPYACRPGSQTALKQYIFHTAAQLRQVAEDGKQVKFHKQLVYQKYMQFSCQEFKNE